MSSIGTAAATVLGVVATLAIVATPAIWWVGITPAALVFVAYRAYIAQSQDKDRVEALFDAATALHRTPQIDRAIEAATQRVIDLVKAEVAVVVLFSTHDDRTPYLTIVDAQGHREVMVPREPPGDHDLPSLATSDRRVIKGGEADWLAEFVGVEEMRQAIIDVLTVSGEAVGVLLAINRLGEVSAFGEADLRVLATLGSQLSTTLENGRLTDTLAEMRSLKEQLEVLVESKDRLVASVSHELRTPLTGVIGLAALIRETAHVDLDEEALGMLDLIVEQGNELANIIEDLLTHARAEAGTLSIRPENFDVIEEMGIVAAGHSIEPPDAEGAVWGFADPLRVRQIVRNLITNARRYGGPSIRIVVERAPAHVSLSVVDDGPGVPPSARAAIFEPYHSAHDQRGQPGSVGLGLAVSRSMAHMMGGELTYRRRTGSTWFTLSIPTIPSGLESHPAAATDPRPAKLLAG